MFSTPGFIKFFWPKDNVQNKYTRIYDIPIIDIHKKIVKLDQTTDNNFMVVHIKNTKNDLQTIRKIQELAKTKVFIVPDQNSPQTFAQIQKVYPSALGKMIFNGEDAHPFAKFLRRNCSQVYDYEMSGGKKSIPLGVFKKQGQKYTYYQGERLTTLLTELQSQK